MRIFKRAKNRWSATLSTVMANDSLQVTNWSLLFRGRHKQQKNAGMPEIIVCKTMPGFSFCQRVQQSKLNGTAVCPRSFKQFVDIVVERASSMASEPIAMADYLTIITATAR